MFEVVMIFIVSFTLNSVVQDAFEGDEEAQTILMSLFVGIVVFYLYMPTHLQDLSLLFEDFETWSSYFETWWSSLDNYQNM